MKPKNIPTQKIKLSKDKGILEKDIEGDNRKFAVNQDILFEKYQSQNNRSVPDRMLTFKWGLLIFIEYKAPGKKATSKQYMDHTKRRDRNQLVYVVDDIEIGRALITRLSKLDAKPWEQNLFEEEIFDNGRYYADGQDTVET